MKEILGTMLAGVMCVIGCFTVSAAEIEERGGTQT